MKAAYATPKLAEYGRAHELTLGATGNNPDNVFGIIGTTVFLTPAPSSNVCTQNTPYGQCTPTSGPGSASNPLTTFTSIPVGSTVVP